MRGNNVRGQQQRVPMRGPTLAPPTPMQELFGLFYSLLWCACMPHYPVHFLALLSVPHELEHARTPRVRMKPFRLRCFVGGCKRREMLLELGGFARGGFVG